MPARQVGPILDDTETPGGPAASLKVLAPARLVSAFRSNGVTTMAVAYACPHCGMSYTLHDSLLGKSVRCKRCANVSIVAATTAPPPASTAFMSADDLDDEATPWRAAPIRQKLGKARGNDTTRIITITLGVILALGMMVVFALVAVRVNQNKVGDQADPQAARDPFGADQGNPAPGADAEGPAVSRPDAFGPRTQTRATLSNARVISRPSPGGLPVVGTSFTVDYRFEGDGPKPGEMYVWVIESRKGKARQMLVGAQPSGSLQGSVPTMQPNDGPFSTYLAVEHGPWLQKVSDTVAMQMRTEPAEPASDSIPPSNAQPPGMPPIPPRFGPRPMRPPIPRPPNFGPRGPRGPRFGPCRMP